MKCLFFRFFFVFITIIVCISSLFGQSEPTIVYEKGKPYQLYTVAQGEGFFSIQKQFNISKEELVDANKGIAEKGLRGGQVLLIPLKTEAIGEEASKGVFHTISKGETLLGITKKYDISAIQLFEWNPELSASTFSIGRTIRVSAPPLAAGASSASSKYIVQPQETLYGISKRFGLTVEDIAVANGNISSVHIGQELNIPDRITIIKPIIGAINEPLIIESKAAGSSFSPSTIKSSTGVSVAILFPLDLEHQSAPELSKRLLEFYRGFILAADSVRKDGIDMSISIYDIGNGGVKIDSIMQTGELNDLDLIIAPSQSEIIDQIVPFAQSHNIRVVLPFSSRGEWVNSNSMVIQMNPPVAMQIALLLEHWKQRYHNANFIFISSKGVVGEKAEFVQSAQNFLKLNSIQYHKYVQSVDSILDIQRLIDPSVENIIVSDFASSRNLKAIMLDLQMLAKQQPSSQIILWGYPEWQTFFTDFGDAYFDLNVHFSTTFYADYSNSELKVFETRYRNLYQRVMLNTYPRFGLLGYDLGLYLLGGKYEKKEVMEGLQSGFGFRRADRNKGGLINQNLFIVEYTKEQIIKRLNISDNK